MPGLPPPRHLRWRNARPPLAKGDRFRQSNRLLRGSAVSDRSDASVDHQATNSGIALFTDGLVSSSEPFPHFAIPAILVPAVADRVLAWFQDNAPWRLRVESFYEQYEFSLISDDYSPLAHE